MTCVPPDRMDLYLEGDLAGAECREIEAHVERCPECRRALERRRLIEEALSSLPAIEVPSGFAAAVLDRLPLSRRTASFGWFISAVTGFLALLAALLGYYLSTGESLLDLLDSMGRSVLAFISLTVPLAAKVFCLVRVAVFLVGDLGTALARSLSSFASLVGPELLALGLLLSAALAALTIFGVKRILSLGGKP